MGTILEALSGAVQDRRTRVRPEQSSDAWVLGVLQKHGTQTLDQIGKLLPEMNWTELFLAVDRLSRSGKISLWSHGLGDYFITVKGTETPIAC